MNATRQADYRVEQSKLMHYRRCGSPPPIGSRIRGAGWPSPQTADMLTWHFTLTKVCTGNPFCVQHRAGTSSRSKRRNFFFAPWLLEGIKNLQIHMPLQIKSQLSSPQFSRFCGLDASARSSGATSLQLAWRVYQATERNRSLDSIQGRHAEEIEAFPHRNARRFAQQEPAVLFV